MIVLVWLLAIDRKEAASQIAAALTRRSDRRWSVRVGRGTVWGWLTISAPPSRLDEFGAMSTLDCLALRRLLDLGGPAHPQGVMVEGGQPHYREFIDRANGRPYTVAPKGW